MAWIRSHLAELELQGKLLLFVSTRNAANSLVSTLNTVTTAGVDCIHGDRDQSERRAVMSRFRKGVIRVLVATDVAARGLDVKDIATGRNSDEMNSDE